MKSYSLILAATLALVLVSADPSYEYNAELNRDILTSRVLSQNLDAFDHQSTQGRAYDDNIDVENNLAVHSRYSCPFCLVLGSILHRYCDILIRSGHCGRLNMMLRNCRVQCFRKGKLCSQLYLSNCMMICSQLYLSNCMMICSQLYLSNCMMICSQLYLSNCMMICSQLYLSNCMMIPQCQ